MGLGAQAGPGIRTHRPQPEVEDVVRGLEHSPVGLVLRRGFVLRRLLPHLIMTG